MAFYAAFPMLLIGIYRRWALYLSLAIVSLASILTAATLLHLPADGNPETVTISSFTYTMPPARVLEFVTGMAAYVFWNRYIRFCSIGVLYYTAIEITVISLAAKWFVRYFWVARAEVASAGPIPYWFGDAGSFWLFAILIVTLAGGKGLIGKALSFPVFVKLGQISFSIYMFHQILIKIFALSYPQWASPVAYFMTLISVSTVSFYMIEEPGRKWLPIIFKRKRQPNTLLSLALDEAPPIKTSAVSLSAGVPAYPTPER